MDNVRLRRLKADHEALRRLAHLHPKIEIEGVFGNPPERYRLLFKVKSLRERGEAVEPANEHRLEVTMPRGYPRDAPLFRMLTPVFHPNIAPHAVCIGDDWTAGEPLDLLIQRVGEILAYQSYNTKSPLNGRAAQWVDEHRDQLPIDREEFFIDLSAAPTEQSTAPTCSNCGTSTGYRDGGGGLTPCTSAKHALCADCTIRCKTCSRVLCLSCGEKTCSACKENAVLCKNCNAPTTGIAPQGSVAKPGQAIACAEWHPLCGDCAITCKTCEAVLCVVCGTYPCRTCSPSVAARV
jgi:hypothetical protein